MPREARRLNAVGTVASLAEIPGILTRVVMQNANNRSNT